MRKITLYRYIPLMILLLAASCHSETHEEEEEDHHESGYIELAPDMAHEFGIEYEVVAPGEFRDVIKTTGTIEAANSDIYTITAKKSGIFTLANSLIPGMDVTSGQKIGFISSAGMQGGDVNQAAVANLRVAKAEYERLKPLYEDGLVTASIFKEAERAYREAEALTGNSSGGGSETVASPIAGNLKDIYVKSGDYVEAGLQVATVVKQSRLMLKADLPVKEIRHLGEIESANIISISTGEVFKLSEHGGQKVSGNTSSSAVAGYLPVYFSYSGDSFSSPGGYTEVYLLCGMRPGVISVPRKSLIEIQGDKYVYVKAGKGHFVKRLVHTGGSDGERVEIISGLNEGDTLVAKGSSIIRMAEVSSVAPPSHSHNH